MLNFRTQIILCNYFLVYTLVRFKYPKVSKKENKMGFLDDLNKDKRALASVAIGAFVSPSLFTLLYFSASQDRMKSLLDRQANNLKSIINETQIPVKLKNKASFVSDSEWNTLIDKLKKEEPQKTSVSKRPTKDIVVYRDGIATTYSLDADEPSITVSEVPGDLMNKIPIGRLRSDKRYIRYDREEQEVKEIAVADIPKLIEPPVPKEDEEKAQMKSRIEAVKEEKISYSGLASIPDRKLSPVKIAFHDRTEKQKVYHPDDKYKPIWQRENVNSQSEQVATQPKVPKRETREARDLSESDIYVGLYEGKQISVIWNEKAQRYMNFDVNRRKYTGFIKTNVGDAILRQHQKRLISASNLEKRTEQPVQKPTLWDKFNKGTGNVMEHVNGFGYFIGSFIAKAIKKSPLGTAYSLIAE